MALSKSESNDDVFLGIGEEDREAVEEWRQARYEARQQSDSESDVFVSFIATEDLSDLTDSEEDCLLQILV